MIHHKNGRPIGLCLMGAIFGGHMVYSTLKKWQRARLIENTPVVPIKSAPQGLVQIQGHAWPAQKIVLPPLSQMPSVFYSLHIEHLQRRGQNSQWVTVYKDSTKDPFYVVDSSGAALVNPDPGECTTLLKTTDVAGLSETQKNNIFGLLGKTPGWFSGRYRVTEGVIVAGGPVYALGTFSTHASAPKFQMSPGAPEFLKTIAQTTHAATLLDLSKQTYVHNGKIDRTEQIAYFNRLAVEIMHQRGINARSAAASAPQVSFAQTTFAKVAGEPNFIPSPISATASVSNMSAHLTETPCAGVMLSTPERKLYFADCHKHELETRLRNWFLLKTLGGAALVAGGLSMALYLMTLH